CSDGTYIFLFSSRRRHTRCYRDWSSDVCSSDLTQQPRFFDVAGCHQGSRIPAFVQTHGKTVVAQGFEKRPEFCRDQPGDLVELEIGRASCRERVVMYVPTESISSASLARMMTQS